MDITMDQAERLKIVLSTFVLKCDIESWPDIALLMFEKDVSKYVLVKMIMGQAIILPKMFDFFVHFLALVFSAQISIICASCIFTSIQHATQDTLLFKSSIILVSDYSELSIVKQIGRTKFKLRPCLIMDFYADLHAQICARTNANSHRPIEQMPSKAEVPMN